MKTYTPEECIFSQSIEITEPEDEAYADLINEAPIQLLQNILVLAAALDANLVDDAFHTVFSYLDDEPEDEGSMTSADIKKAISTEWNGESSSDPTAMDSEDVATALETEWNGENTSDPTALSSKEVAEAIDG